MFMYVFICLWIYVYIRIPVSERRTKLSVLFTLTTEIDLAKKWMIYPRS